MSRTVAGHKPTIKQLARIQAIQHRRELEEVMRHKMLQQMDAGEPLDFSRDRTARQYLRRQVEARSHFAVGSLSHRKPGRVSKKQAKNVDIGGDPTRQQKLQGLHDTYKPGGAGYKAARARAMGRVNAPKTKVAIDLPGAKKTIAKKPIMKRQY